MSSALPEGPRLPGVAQALAWVVAPAAFLEACRRRYGTTFTVRPAGLPPLVILADPAAVREVLTGDHRVFGAGAANATMKPTMWLRAFGERSLLLLDGQEHAAMRRLMAPVFHADRLESYRLAMEELVHAAIDGWPVGSPFSLAHEMRELTLDIVVRTLFRAAPGERATALRRAFADLLTLGEHPALQFFASARRRLRGRALFERALGDSTNVHHRRVIARVEAELTTELERRRAGEGSPDDAITTLLGARATDEAAIDDRVRLDELKTLLLAAHDTTATSLGWALHELLAHPAILDRLRGELTRDDEYLDAIVREALRLHPVVPILARRLLEGARVGGRYYPAGTILAPSVHLLHRDPATWREPERFDPDRFLSGSRVAATDAFAFGMGSRRCLGMSFALLTLRTVVRAVVARGRLALAPRARSLVPRPRGLAIDDGLLVVRAASLSGTDRRSASPSAR